MRSHWLIAAVAAGLVPGVAAAQMRPGFAVDLEVFDYAYRERVDDSTIVRDDGTLLALSASYVETIGAGWHLKALASGADGKVDYRNDEGARLNNADQQISRLEFGIGRDVPIGSAVLTPMLGIGVRTLTDDLGGRTASDGTIGYDREISYFHAPVGLELGVPVGRSRFGIAARYGFIFAGTARSKLSQADERLPNLNLDINGGHLWEINARLSVPIGRRALSFGPFVRRWSADASESTIVRIGTDEITFFEPRARTTEAGLRVGFAF